MPDNILLLRGRGSIIGHVAWRRCSCSLSASGISSSATSPAAASCNAQKSSNLQYIAIGSVPSTLANTRRSLVSKSSHFQHFPSRTLFVLARFFASVRQTFAFVLGELIGVFIVSSPQIQSSVFQNQIYNLRRLSADLSPSSFANSVR